MWQSSILPGAERHHGGDPQAVAEPPAVGPRRHAADVRLPAELLQVGVDAHADDRIRHRCHRRLDGRRDLEGHVVPDSSDRQAVAEIGQHRLVGHAGHLADVDRGAADIRDHVRGAAARDHGADRDRGAASRECGVCVSSIPSSAVRTRTIDVDGVHPAPGAGVGRPAAGRHLDEAHAAVGDADGSVAGLADDDAVASGDLVLDQRPGAQPAAALLIGHRRQHESPAEAVAVGHRVPGGDDHPGDGALHVQAAAAVEPAVADLGRPRVARPPVGRRVDGDDVEMPAEDERASRLREGVRRHDADEPGHRLDAGHLEHALRARPRPLRRPPGCRPAGSPSAPAPAAGRWRRPRSSSHHHSPARAARDDRPHVHDLVPRHHVVDVVQVHGRRGVARDQLDPVAAVERRVVGEVERAVLLGEEPLPSMSIPAIRGEA